MALRSVVVQPPPKAASPATPAAGPRRTVVARAGPPPHARGRFADMLAGIVGILLLVATIGLVQVLPEDEVILPQFTLFFVHQEGGSRNSTTDIVFTEAPPNNVKTYAFEVPDNAFELVVRMSFTDDIAASLPDRFRIEILDPTGDVRGGEALATSAPPTTLPPPDQFTYVATPTTVVHRISIAVVPPDEIVPGTSADETQGEVLDRIAPDHVVESAGTWTARITLIEAGDCPSADQSDQNRVLACRLDAQDGEDHGNAVTLEAFLVSYFVPCVQLLDAKVLATCLTT